jgi:uncharacterized repeat protein (TIGR01451 family)
MSKRTLVGLIVLLLIVAGIVWLARSKTNVAETPVLSVTAFNQTKNAPAQNANANPGDVIVYTLTAENQSDKVVSGYIIEASVADITDKAALMDASGASYNAATNSLVWTPLDIPAKGSVSKQFSVKVNTLPVGTNPILKIKFNNDLEVAIANPAVAGNVTPTPSPSGRSPSVAYKAPVTGASEWLPAVLAAGLVLILAFFKKYRLAKS